MSELRWHPLLGEWVATATHRQERTFFPPPDYCPLCPTKPGGFPTEIAASDFEIVVFENRFPSLQRIPPDPAVPGDALEPVRPAQGVCEVVVYTPEHEATLAQASVERIEALIRVWAHRTRELGALPFVEYVYIFENKGAQIGVTLSHPHGQIYAYPFVPPIPARELANARAYYDDTGRCQFCAVIGKERTDRIRVLGETEHAIAYVPFFARYPYEVHVATRAHVSDLTALDGAQRRDLARVLKATLVAYDRLFDLSFPYIMAVHQAPTDGAAHPEAHLHIEFYPPLRTATKLKYLAGSEAGAGMFINDTLAEEKAAEIRAHWTLP